MSEDIKSDAAETAMNMLKQNGGPFHPHDFPLPEGGTLSTAGLTIRDWFAGQALNGICASSFIGDHAGTNKTDKAFLAGCAARAFMFADGMLAERVRK